ncbi:CHASE4 domain-containing protein, partial [Piscirickettsia litoralis]|uniref:CHASE4 domain-containing protein n=1 Tax=Piscirickettsia litoralis TaxID=1891921 RepID=UPI00130182BC
KNKKYIDSNLGDNSFYDNEVNLIYYFDVKNNLVWGKSYDLLNEVETVLPKETVLAMPKSSRGGIRV